MKRYLTFAGVLLLGIWCQPACAQSAAKGSYMQIFYEGPSWLSGRRVLSYSPAFRGKTEEIVAEPDSLRRISPNGLVDSLDELSGKTFTGTVVSVTDDKGTFVPDGNGKLRPQTATDRKLDQQQEINRRNRSFKLLETRTDLGRTTLLNALNAAAADGWEVVQLAPWGQQGGLVYLLRHR